MDTYIVSSARKDHEGRFIEFDWVRVDGHMQPIGHSQIVGFNQVCEALGRGDEVFVGDGFDGAKSRAFLGLSTSGEQVIELEANVSNLEQIGDLPRF
ncbi:hypothetical protein CMV24_09075 [Pseudomonas plecoglossicida]|uniref:DUF3892 domain-containing protein n=2 Tax=Pseudomonas TaxID=286 RepID=A0A2A3M7H2_PSEDL|nr:MULTISPECIES: hypothetical protein [Pseudomonas]MDD2109873.1 hypothetical protein [Pseudomonas asiatica]MDM9587717.1 hypothetical protein [Pseudomonas asiatica]PBJ95974.1 hypothetical protein CMV24_09075 [Pseudomonas plecoglossicida]